MSTSVAPAAGGSAQSRAAVRLREAARDREPEAVPTPPLRRAEGWKTRSSSAARDPGPSSATRITTSPPALAGDADVTARRRETRSALSSRLTSTRRDMRGVDLDRRQLWPGHRRTTPRLVAELVERQPDELVDRPELAPRLGRAGLEPREVEQVARPSGRGAPSRCRSSRPAPPGRSSSSASAGFARPLGGGPDRGQRRAEVVRDGAQHRRLDRVAPPQRLRLERLAFELLPVDRDREQRRERGEERRATAASAVAGARRRERPDRAPADRERACATAPATGSPRRARSARVRRRARRPRARRCRPSSSVERPAAAAATRRPPRAAPPRAHAARRSVARAAGPRGELARHDGDDEVHGEREPVLAVSQVERVGRRQEEPVEGEHARDGDRERVREPPDDRDRQHGEDVERAEAEHGRPVVEDADEHRDERDGAGAGQHPDHDVVAAVPHRAPRDHRASVAAGPDPAAASFERRMPALPGRASDGAEGARTPDLLAASQTLSQLSYGPASAGL